MPIRQTSRAALVHALRNVTRALVTFTAKDSKAELLKLKNGETPGKAYQEKCEGYAAAMTFSEWVHNGDPIIYDEDGNLVEGEARFRASVISGKSFTAFVIRGIKAEAVPTLGSGIQRSAADALTISGETLATEISGAWPIIGGYLRMIKEGRGYKALKRPDISPDQALELGDRFPQIHDSAEKVRALKDGLRPFGPGLATAVHYLASQVDPTKATQFLNQLSDPVLEPDSAATRVPTLIRPGPHMPRMRQETKLAHCVKAFNLFRTGEPFTDGMISYKQGVGTQDGGEIFPRFQDFPCHEPLRYAGKGKTAPKKQSPWFGVVSEDIEVLEVTPAMAEQMLEYNGPIGSKGNRAVRQFKVLSIARDMKSGRYFYNGQPLKFSRYGYLLDGQHRLKACIEANVPFITAIVRNLDDSVFTTLDTGSRKGHQYYLKARNSAHTPSKVKIKQNYMLHAAVVNLYNKVTSDKWVAPTNLEVLENTAAHPDILALISDKAKAKIVAETRMTASAAWTLWYMADQVNPKAAEIFFKRLADLNWGSDKAAKTLAVFCRHLLAIKESGRNPQAEHVLRDAMQVWNLWRSGTRIEHMPVVTSYPKLIP